MTKLRPVERIAPQPSMGSDVPLLDVTGVRKAYGDVLALDDVTLQVPVGGSLGLVGRVWLRQRARWPGSWWDWRPSIAVPCW
ncbi:MAG: hypothetical protein WKF73_15600 [Nocardioidaceae bacterium]